MLVGCAGALTFASFCPTNPWNCNNFFLHSVIFSTVGRSGSFTIVEVLCTGGVPIRMSWQLLSETYYSNTSDKIQEQKDKYRMSTLSRPTLIPEIILKSPVMPWHSYEAWLCHLNLLKSHLLGCYWSSVVFLSNYIWKWLWKINYMYISSSTYY